MEASVLKRLDALEAAATAVATLPIVLIKVHRFDPADRDAFWNGNQTVLSRYGLPDGPAPTGSIRALVINVHSASRED